MSTENKNMVCLYIFTHNITGLKYFGKTTLHFTIESLLKYKGSGKYWNSHLKIHGNDLSVEIYGIFHKDEVKEIALQFSKENDIVKSLNESGDRKNKKVWANEKDENGLDGGGLPKGFKHSEETKENMRAYRKGKKKIKKTNYFKTYEDKNREPMSIDTKMKISESKKGVKPTVETKNKMSNSKKGDKNHFFGKFHSEETKDKMKGPRETSICPYCYKEGRGGNMKRYHFDNCKYK